MTVPSRQKDACVCVLLLKSPDIAFDFVFHAPHHAGANRRMRMCANQRQLALTAY
ncbi:hypothetical protein EVA_08223 [gut metagenome]|uniref:Uncharacterized protein n=1 Tax=gut metagenome TaxID=749906 RepID=J9CTX9_9ZZZZ